MRTASNLTARYDPNDRASEIDLPDGSKYSFLYHSYGDIAKITLPTGGVVQSDHNVSIASAPASPAAMYVMARALAKRSELLGGIWWQTVSV